MEERVISYDSENDVDFLVAKLSKQKFILTRHATREKKLFFKKFETLPESVIIGEP